MSHMKLVILVVWIVFLASAFIQGLALPQAPDAPMPFDIWLVILIVAFALFLLAPFLQRRTHMFEIGPLRNLVDGKWGAGTYAAFIAGLRPVLLFMLAGLILGGTGLISTYSTTQSASAYFHSGFFLSAGLGLLSAYLLSLVFPPELV
jgi:hypothetical protein